VYCPELSCNFSNYLFSLRSLLSSKRYFKDQSLSRTCENGTLALTLSVPYLVVGPFWRLILLIFLNSSYFPLMCVFFVFVWLFLGLSALGGRT